MSKIIGNAGVVGREYGSRHLVAQTDDGHLYYLTPCCRASAKGSFDGVVCRNCYELVDPALGGIPMGKIMPF